MRAANAFYSDFDRENFPARRSRRADDSRTEFSIDRDRIIFSSAFRRLQSKTQVFHSGEYDFYRTRLTHSLEVAQIGRGICEHLRHAGQPLHDDFFIDPDLVEACCLAHDLGHPPFGHAGETALNEVMRESGGFEGNAQTLRILTNLLFGDGGMKPTRALLDGVLKYKRPFVNPEETPRKFVLEDQRDLVTWIAGGTAKSIECQIMDWSDDIAYGLMDIVDGVNAQFITLDSLAGWEGDGAILDELRDTISERQIERVFARKVGQCILATRLLPRGNAPAQTQRHAFDLAVSEEARVMIDFYKRLAEELIFRTPQIKQLEFKGRRILAELFNTLRNNYRAPAPARLLPPHLEAKLRATDGKPERLICDHVSSLTDAGAIRMYRRLFDPEFGSIKDL